MIKNSSEDSFFPKWEKTPTSASDDAPQTFIVEFMYEVLINNRVAYQESHKVDTNINHQKRKKKG
jgi:hypothetical protein